ncbi:MAG: radical SAM family heme chaperone HemW [Clostridia bacterium]|nr:radical SAM family heme chaperone HemW [Clostridia bacterium]
MKKPLSLYIHLPFCNSKCNYCSFVSEVRDEKCKQRYVKALVREIQIQGAKYNKHFEIRTVFIGGGTPSSLPLGGIREIMSAVYKNFSVKADSEITIELNPNSASAEKIHEYVLAGVNRFSIGLQCTNGKVLSKMGRTHTSADFDKTIETIREYGISNINADVMLGFPGQTLADVKATLEHLIALKLPHISSYMLSVEEGTKLETMIDKGVLYLPTEKQVVNMYNTTVSVLEKNGYERYELSNFARPGFASKHNNVYWNRTDYLGVGVSSHSYVAGVRFANTSKIDDYIKIVETQDKPPVSHAKKITVSEKREEAIMLSLRTMNGLSVDEFQKEFGENILSTKNDALKKLIKLGLVIIDKNNNIKVTDKGYLVLNRIILELA